MKLVEKILLFSELLEIKTQIQEMKLAKYVNDKYTTDIEFDWEEFNKGC